MALPKKKSPLFWLGASYKNKKDPTYIANRNLSLASDYSSQWINDRAGVSKKLNENKSFARANTIDKYKTTSNILNNMRSATATAQNPVTTVTAPTGTPDYNAMDLGQLQDELAGYNYDSRSGNISREWVINMSRIQRLIQEKARTSWSIDNSEIEKMQAQRDALYWTQQGSRASRISAINSEIDALAAQRIADQEAAGREALWAAQSATSSSWFGRSTFSAEKQTQIANETARATAAIRAAAEQEKYRQQRELEWADAEELASIDQNINNLKGNAAQINQWLQADLAKSQQTASNNFYKSLDDLIVNSGLDINLNDKEALQNIISTARNADGTVNESIIKSLDPKYQAIVRAWVTNWLGTPKTDYSKINVQRLWGTNKAPKYGYIDPTSGKIVYTDEYGSPTGWGARTGGGGVGWNWATGNAWDWAVNASELLNDPNLSISVWFKSLASNIPWTPQFAFKKKVDNYVNNLVLPKLKYLKGATSDKDIKFIQWAATSLDIWLPEKDFRDTLKNMGAVLAKYDANGNPIAWASNTTTTTPAKKDTTKKTTPKKWSLLNAFKKI